MSNHLLCTTTGLDLGLGFSHAPPVGAKNPSWPITSDPLVAVPAAAAASTSSGGFLTLRLSSEASNYDADKCVGEYSGDLCGQDEASPHSAVSSFSNSAKRERDGGAGSEELLEVEKVCSRGSFDEDEDGSNNARKKLRLTKQQSALLEQNFKRHSTLNPAQKQALAKELNLRPRQVEVWFQNRRARTKLKQIEVECEYLKKCCESLKDENRKLQKEVQELKAMKAAAAAAQPLYVQLPAVSNLAVCPSCGESCPAPKTPFIITVHPTARFFN